MKKVAVLGAGFAGLSAATCLARAGFDVTLFEKNDLPGGRARQFQASGYTFDMGPSWYWMPDVFESYFAVFGRSTSDYYKLERLDPPYRIYFGKGDFMDLPAGTEALAALFEKLEPGSKNRIEKSIASDFEEGYGGIKKLPRSARFGVYVAYVYYSALFKKIRRLHSSQVLRSRVRVPNRNKLAILGYSFVKHQLNLI